MGEDERVRERPERREKRTLQAAEEKTGTGAASGECRY